MTKIAASDLTAEVTYRLLTGIVVPRPIAWVTTISRDACVNLAPYSCFTFVSSSPPMLGLSIGRIAGNYKDTGRNIREMGEFVVHIADESQIENIHLSAVEHPPNVSEAELLGLDLIPSEIVAPPRLKDAPISMECRLHQTIAFGRTGTEFIVGEVILFHIRDGLINNSKIDTAELRPTCRLGGPNYGKLGEIVTMRPVFQTEKTEITNAAPADPTKARDVLRSESVNVSGD